MEPREVTWAIVALAGIQTVHAIVTAWFAWAESRCRQQLRMMKHEVAGLRQQMTSEGWANRHAIADIAAKVGAGGREKLPPAV